MIKLNNIIKEAIHVQYPKEKKGEQEKKHIDQFNSSFLTVPTNEDPETGKKSWDVIYTDDPKKNKRIMFARTYQTLKKLADTFEEVASLPTYSKDGEMHTFAKALRTLEQKFKEYIIKRGKMPFQK